MKHFIVLFIILIMIGSVVSASVKADKKTDAEIKKAENAVKIAQKNLADVQNEVADATSPASDIKAFMEFKKPSILTGLNTKLINARKDLTSKIAALKTLSPDNSLVTSSPKKKNAFSKKAGKNVVPKLLSQYVDGEKYEVSEVRGVFTVTENKKGGKKLAVLETKNSIARLNYYSGDKVSKSYVFNNNKLVVEGTLSSDGKIFVLTRVNNGKYSDNSKVYKVGDNLYSQDSEGNWVSYVDNIKYVTDGATFKKYDLQDGSWVEKTVINDNLGDADIKNLAAIEKLQSEISTRSNAQNFIKTLEKAQGWSALSSLFCKRNCFSEWSTKVDEVFHKAYLGTEYWSEAICKTQSGVGDVGSAFFTLSEDGFLIQSASIAASKQRIDTPEGVKWLYKVSYFVRNPQSNSKKITKNKGTRVASNDMSTEEATLWNSIQSNVKTIGNKYAKTSRTSVDKGLSYNLEFQGSRSIDLFTDYVDVDSGDESANTGDNSFAAYSTNDYSKVCLKFKEKPLDAFYNKVSEICASIKDVTNTKPTIISLANAAVDKSRSRGGMRSI